MSGACNAISTGRERLRGAFRGALLGLAVGDALGAAVEFKASGTFEPVTGMRGGGAFGLAPGQWTDDTSMAICLATSLVAQGKFDPASQMDLYLRWWLEGRNSSTGACFAIGKATRQALGRYLANGDPYAGKADPAAAGNGSLMRLAPVPLFFFGDADAAIRHAGLSSLTTHGSPLATDACRYFAALLAGAVNGASKEELLAEPYEPLPGYWKTNPLAPEIMEIARGSFKRREPPQIRGTGFVVKSLEAALWAFNKGDGFRDAVLLAANLGEDADTTAAICGQLAGAFYGARAIPEEWLCVLHMADEIGRLAENLLDAAIAAAPYLRGELERGA